MAEQVAVPSAAQEPTEQGSTELARALAAQAQIALVRRMRAGAVVVPLAAIVPHKGEHYVFATENGRAVRKRVLIGALIGHEAVLDGGLSAGDRIVVEGHRGLQDGMKVDIVAGDGELSAEAAPAETEPLPASEE